MTADEARRIDGMFGCIEANGEEKNYPVKIYGTVVKVDSYWLTFLSMDEVVVKFSLRKITKFGFRPKRKPLKAFKIPLIKGVRDARQYKKIAGRKVIPPTD